MLSKAFNSIFEGHQLPFHLEHPRYDQGIYMGRLAHFLRMANPMMLIPSEEDIRANQAKLEAFKESKKVDADLTEAERDDLMYARDLVGSAVHPDTNEIMGRVFRMGAFVPANVPICSGMLFSPPTMGWTILWQWMNQSYNAAFNYANRSIPRDGSSNENFGETAKAYTLACTTSCGVALAFGKFVASLERRGFGKASLAVMRTAVPYVAVALAGSLNILAMRWSILDEGVTIMDPDGREVGKGKLAARQALAECAISRIILPIPILLAPPPIIAMTSKIGFIKRSKSMQGLNKLVVLTACLGFAFPSALAIFPQIATAQAKNIEKQFQGLKDSKGNVVEKFTFNKGL